MAEMNQARVSLRNGRQVTVPITSLEKPGIPAEISGKWNSMLDLLCKILKIHVALIMKVESDSISVFGQSRFPGNPYRVGETEKLGGGLYCETVLGTRAPLKVPDALQDSAWATNPDVRHDMISYLGLPLAWPDGELFGTVCVLDRKRNFEDPLAREVLAHFQDVLQSDLNGIVEREELKRLHVLDSIVLKETFHRMKNQLSQLYSLIQINSGPGSASLDFLETISRRLRSIIIVHDILSNSEENTVHLTPFLNTLSHKIISDVYGKVVSLSVSGPDVLVSSNIALTIGAIVNELITNSIKYAFDTTGSPRIEIAIKDDEETFTLEYTDNGPGFADSDIAHKGTTIGLSLIKTYPLLINGLSELDHRGRFSYKVEAPKMTK